MLYVYDGSLRSLTPYACLQQDRQVVHTWSHSELLKHSRSTTAECHRQYALRLKSKDASAMGCFQTCRNNGNACTW